MPNTPTEQTLDEVREKLFETMDKLISGEISGEEAKRITSEKGKTLITEEKTLIGNKKNPNPRGTSKVNALSDRAIKSAKPKEKDYKLTDGEGLFLIISKAGGKRWKFKYRFEGKDKTLSIGGYPAISLAYARELKNEYRSQVARGISPADEKQKVKQEKEKEIITTQKKSKFTFEKLAGDLLKEWRTDGSISESTYKRNYLYLNKDAYPIIGHLPIGEITLNNIKTVITNVKDRGAVESSRKLFYALNKTFKKLVSRNNPDNPKYDYDLEFNPCALIDITDLVGEESKAHYPTITDPKEIKALLLAIDGYKGELSTKRALQLLPYTALRPGNVRLAEWEEIDIENKLWVIPAKKMKTKNDFTVPLTDQMIDVFEAQTSVSGGQRYVFPSQKDKSRALSDNTFNGALRRLGYTKEEFTAHGFRAMFSTILNERSKFAHELIEASLAHNVGNAVSRAYNRTDYLQARKELMEWWCEYLGKVKA